MRICVITYYWKVVCTLLEVWVLGVGMSTLDTQTSLYIEDYRDSTVRQTGICLLLIEKVRDKLELYVSVGVMTD
jgi:hypothetical protein